MTELQPLINVRDIVRHLWSRRWLIIACGLLAPLASWILIKTYAGETFESRFSLMVRPSPQTLRDNPRPNPFEAPVYEDLLLNDDLLMTVISAARAKFPKEYGNAKFEEAKKAFFVKSIATRETSMQTTYSPILVLRVQGGSPAIAKFLADEWLRLGVERYGTLQSTEGEQIAEASSRELTARLARNEELRKEVYELQRQLAEFESAMVSKYRILWGGFREPSSESIETGARGSNYSPSSTNLSETKIEVSNETGGADLWGSRSKGLQEEEVRLQLALAEAGGDASKAPGLAQRLETLRKVMADTAKEAADLGKQRAALLTRLESAREEQRSIRATVDEIARVMAVAATAGAAPADPNNPDVKGDFRILARPVMPEQKVWPPRTVLAVGIGGALTTLLVLVLLLELYLKRAVLD